MKDEATVERSVVQGTKKNALEMNQMIIWLLRERHPAPEWATFKEVPDSAGFEGQGRIDFFAFNTYPSKRFLRVAYEVKISRADFARELREPGKRGRAEQLANECWFVMPAGMVKPDEIPEGWGLLEVTTSNELRVKKQAQYTNVLEPPLGFVALMLRRSSEKAVDVPKVLWKYQGEEIPFDVLTEFATKEVKKQIDTAVFDAEEAAMERLLKRWDVQAWRRVYEVVEKILGKTDPEFLEGVLTDKLQPYLKPEQRKLLIDMLQMAQKVVRTLPS